MVSFSLRSFKECLHKPLERAELNFLIRTFFLSSLYFFVFAIVCGTINTIITSIIGNPGFFASSIFTVIGFVSYFPLHWFVLKYRNNPLRMPVSFVSTIFLILSFSFMFIFLGLTNAITALLKNKYEITDGEVWSAILFLFGISFFIYLIPASAAFFIKSKKKIVTLNKFLNGCYILYICIFFIFIVSFIFGMGITSGLHIFLIILSSAMVLISPVITIYRMKSIAPYINHEDPYERRRWEGYFVFEISFQLLQLAFHVMRLALILINTPRSRLK